MIGCVNLAIELGDLDRGYSAIDITGKDERLYSLTCPLMLGVFIMNIPKTSKGKQALVPKNKAGQPLTTGVGKAAGREQIA